MGDDTSIRVSEELADELYRRKGRGTSYEDYIWSLLERVDDEHERQQTEERVEEGDTLERAQRLAEETETVASLEEGAEDTDDHGLDIDGISDRVSAAVREVSATWNDTDSRLVKRRWAAERALQHALDTGDAVGKSDDVVEELFEENPVEGQNFETYWRNNIRPVLKEYGEYSQARHGYVVDSLEGVSL